MRYSIVLVPVFSMLGACSGESVLHEERSQLTAACSEGCDDPMPVAGQPATGGGAGVGTSSTAAAGKAKTNALWNP